MPRSSHTQESVSLPSAGAHKLHGLLETQGAMTVANFMRFALTDEDTGYYTTTQPLGPRGDFTTSPEVSPLFGEIVAAKLIHTWQEMGSPSPFLLVELGPGRGTLMADVLRVGARVPGFIEGARVCLVEKSPILRQVQEETLKPYTTPTWFEALEGALQNAPLPLFLLANEFFDALPIHQYEVTHEGWRERGITRSADGRLAWCFLETTPPALPHADLGTITQSSPETHAHLEMIFAYLTAHGGASFICDYGFIQGWGDTLQGVKDHTFCDVLTHVGSCDISAHVDFGRMEMLGRTFGRLTHHLTTQGAFLKENHIEVRAQQLLPKAKDPKALLAALTRLVDEKAMGTLFKVFFTYANP